nr:chemotaxis protein CheW [Actinomycetes bacterium]
SVMKTRMQPIRVISSRVNRTVRDLQRELNKQLKLVIYGGDTEIDRQLMEVLRDPIMHIIRKAADHGIDSLQERRSAKKPDHGTITFTASQQDGHIIIRISDDGGGIDTQRLRDTIVKRGLATPAELDSQRDYQLYEYMFLPGFSTASQVSSVSGRGVGLDVVKSNIDNIGGVVEVTSQINVGTTFVVKLPLTLAIVDSLIVKIAEERFAVPQISIVELVHIRAGGDHYIDHVQNTPVLRLRDRMFPLVSIRQLLGLIDEDPETSAALPAAKKSTQNALRAKTATTIDVTPEEAETEAVDGMEAPTSKGKQRRAKSTTGKTKTRQQRSANKYLHEKESFVIVTKVGSMEFGMIVDLVFDTEQIVVKPTSSVLRDIPFFNGNTILGDGQVIMILDPNGVVSSVSDIDARKQTVGAHDNTLEYEGNRVTYLLFAADDETQKAVPVGVVSRLDEINLAEVEYPNHRPSLQYRGSLMPLIDLHGIPNLPPEGKAQVIVFASDDQAVGLIVERVIDITDSIHEIQGAKDSRGILGSSVVNGKATDIIDSQYYWNLAFPGQRDLRLIGGGNAERERPTVILIDQNTFFRDLLVPYITAEGYRVISLSDTKTALDLCSRGQHASVILLDIDHNNTDAFAFIQAIDNNSAWSATPVYGLSENPNQATRNINDQRLKFINFFDKRDSGAILESISSHQ